MLPLTLAKAGEQVRVARIGGTQEIKKHLEDLGFVEGTMITVVSAHEGDVIINLRESKLALVKDMAARVMVQTA